MCSLMIVRVDLRLVIPSVVKVVSCPIDVLNVGDVCDKLKSRSTLVLILA